MQTSDFIPTLQPMVTNVALQLRFICFFILTASLILQTAKSRSSDLTSLVRPIVKVTILSALLATLPFWFNLLRDSFWQIAVSIRSEFASSPASTGAELIKLLRPPQEGFNWLDVGKSLMKAVQFAVGWLVVFVGGSIQAPMLLVQFVMECLCFMFLPIALSLFALQSTKGIALRYVQQTLAILAWPIGFAVVDLVGYSLLTSVMGGVNLVVSAAVGFTPASLVVGLVTSLWLLFGSLATPIAMQALFCSGSPLSSSVGGALQFGLSAMGIARFGGLSRLSSSGLNPGSPGAPGSSTPSTPPPAPSSPGAASLAMAPIHSAPLSAQTTASSQPSKQNPIDQTGKARVQAVLAQQRIPQPIRY